MHYKHVIWDWNGTLLDDAAVCVEILNGLLCRRGLARLTPAAYREQFDFPVLNFYAALGVDFEKETFAEIGHEYIAGYTARLGDCRLRGGARALVTQLKERGLSQSILSAYEQKKLEEAVAFFGLQDVFMRLIGLDDYSAHSKVANGRRWMQELPLAGGEVLFVGDTRHDFEVAQAIGVDCVLLTCGHQSPGQLARCGCRKFADLDQLRVYLLGE